MTSDDSFKLEGKINVRSDKKTISDNPLFDEVPSVGIKIWMKNFLS